MAWLIILAILIIGLIIVIAKKIRPWWEKLILIILIIAGIIFSILKFTFPLKDPLETTGPYNIKNEKVFYTNETKFPNMATDGKDREIPVLLWMPDGPEEYPLIIFSHGSFGIGESNSSLFSELASHGYMVASLEHPYHTFVTTISDGNKIHVDGSFLLEVMSSQGSENLEKTREEISRWNGIRVEDISFVMDSLLSDPELSKFIDEEKVFLSGHSLGGGAALELGRRRSNELLGVIALESPFFGDIVGIKGDQFVFTDEEYPIPVLHFYSDAL